MSEITDHNDNIPVSLKRSHDRGDKVQQGMKDLIQKTSEMLDLPGSSKSINLKPKKRDRMSYSPQLEDEIAG